jgi:hypothetical protein
MYFSSVLLAFLGDFIANKLRVKKLNIEKNTKRKRNK